MEETHMNMVLCFSVSRNQIPDYNPEEKNWTEKILDDVGDFKSLEEVVSKLTEKLNLTESQVAGIRKTLIKAEEEAAKVPPPPKSAANPCSKSKKKNMKKQASKQQTQAELLLDPADDETIEAMKKEISTTLDLLKIVQHLHNPTRVGVRQVRASAGDKISGRVRAGNKISGLVRAGSIVSEQVRAGSISEQAGLRKHVGNRWE
ncbi:PREDICTED: uncharacterized protein LOC104782738 [Camelina sativa]|uniref:Uncharacterized protein LOC104782738 n=1 Tax=Camelina sativa TaxID=90675 RepID=A0ABM0YUG9_CAMSA|nr:PREDICTED: uncharacterized protein LOC104782738 [Camelina sativa]